MNDNMNEFKELINLIKAVPKVPAPDSFTQGVMGRLPAGQRTNLWRLFWQPIADTAAISWNHFSRESSERYSSCTHFLIAGFFFFFIGAVMLSSLFYIRHLSGIGAFVLIQAFFVIMAALSLVGAGIGLATNMPDAPKWAKRAIMLFGVFVVGNAVIIHTTVRTTPGGLLAMTFIVAGIVTATTLFKSLQRWSKENFVTFKEGLYNV